LKAYKRQIKPIGKNTWKTSLFVTLVLNIEIGMHRLERLTAAVIIPQMPYLLLGW
jgi:hypothetical protein